MKNEFLDKRNEKLRTALNHVSKGEVERGLELIEAFLADKPKAAAGHRAKGMALATLGRFSEAVESTRTAIRLAENPDPGYYFDLGEWLLEAGIPDEAYEALTTSMELMAEAQESFYMASAIIARAVAAYKSRKHKLVIADLRAIDDDARFFCAGEVWSKEKLRNCLRRK